MARYVLEKIDRKYLRFVQVRNILAKVNFLCVGNDIVVNCCTFIAGEIGKNSVWCAGNQSVSHTYFHQCRINIFIWLHTIKTNKKIIHSNTKQIMKYSSIIAFINAIRKGYQKGYSESKTGIIFITFCNKIRSFNFFIKKYQEF